MFEVLGVQDAEYRHHAGRGQPDGGVPAARVIGSSGPAFDSSALQAVGRVAILRLAIRHPHAGVRCSICGFTQPVTAAR